MFRFLIAIVCFLSISVVVKAQYYTHFGRGFFGIGQAAIVKCYELEQTTYTASQGWDVTDLSSTSTFGFGANYTTGYFLVKNKLSFGAGLGIYSYHNPNFGYLPLYGDLRFYMTKEPDVPYLLLQVGGGLKAGKSFKNGNYFKFGIGFKGFVGDGLCIVGEASWQPFSVSNTGESVNVANDTYSFKAVSFTIGIMFF